MPSSAVSYVVFVLRAAPDRTVPLAFFSLTFSLNCLTRLIVSICIGSEQNERRLSIVYQLSRKTRFLDARCFLLQIIMLEDLPSYDYYSESCRRRVSLSLALLISIVPSECYITAFEDSISKESTPKKSRTIDILLPNGLVVCIERESEQTLADLRYVLRKNYAITWPFHFLSITHTFTNDAGDLLLDEQQCLDTLGLVYPFLRVSARGELPAPLCQWLSPIDQCDMETLVQFIEQIVEWRDETTPQELLHAPSSIAQHLLAEINTFDVHLDLANRSYKCTSQTTSETLINTILTDENKSLLDYCNASTRPVLKFSYRNEYLVTSEPTPLLQYVYVQECLQRNATIHVQLLYVELPKKSKKIGQTIGLTEPDMFPSARPLRNSLPLTDDADVHLSQLLPNQPVSSLFRFTFRLPPSSDASKTLFQFHSGIYYGRRCLFSFEPIAWKNTCIEEMKQSTTIPMAHILPGTMLCFALTSKQSESYFLNVSLFRSNGCLLNGSHEFAFNPTQTTKDTPNSKHLYPDAFVGSSSSESPVHSYKLKLKFDFPSFRFYANDEIATKLNDIHMPTPAAVATAKQQQHHDPNTDVANGEALNYLLGVLNDEVDAPLTVREACDRTLRLDPTHGQGTSVARRLLGSTDRCPALSSARDTSRYSSCRSGHGR